jgi:hypothetical protein
VKLHIPDGSHTFPRIFPYFAGLSRGVLKHWKKPGKQTARPVRRQHAMNKTEQQISNGSGHERPTGAVHSTFITNLLVAYLGILLLFAGRDINGATRLASQLRHDTDQATLTGSVDLESHDPYSSVRQSTWTTNNRKESTPTPVAAASTMIIVTSDTGTPDSLLRKLPYSNGQKRAFAGATAQAAISDGYLGPDLLERRRPSTHSNERQFRPAIIVASTLRREDRLGVVNLQS